MRLKSMKDILNQQTKLRCENKTYYDKFKEEFYPLYKQFIEEFVKPQFGYDEIIYQKIPTFRVHQVDNLGVGE